VGCGIDNHDVVFACHTVELGRQTPARKLSEAEAQPLPVARVEAQFGPARERALRIDIGGGGAQTAPREIGGQVRGERGFARPSLLLRDDDDPTGHKPNIARGHRAC
jgi:hypothetical protein